MEDQFVDPALQTLLSSGEAPQGAFLGPDNGEEDSQGKPLDLSNPLMQLFEQAPSQEAPAGVFDPSQSLMQLAAVDPHMPVVSTSLGEVPTAPQGTKVIQRGEEKPINTPFRYADEPEGTFHTKSAMPQPTGTVATPESKLFGDNFAARLQTIKDTTDPRAKMELFSQLQVDAAQEVSAAMTQMRQQASLKLGVTALEQQLAKSQFLDRQASPYGQYIMSAQTKMLATQLEHARASVDHEAKAMIQSNLRINTIKAQMDTMGKLIDYDMKRADRRADKIETMELQSQFDQQKRLQGQKDKSEAQAEQIMLQTRPEQRQRLGYIFPSLVNPDGTVNDTEAASLIAKGKLGQHTLDMLKVPPSALISKAVAGGEDADSQTARMLVIGEESKKTGVPAQEVGKTLDKISSLAGDAKQVNLIAANLYGRESEQYKAFAAEQAAAITGTAKKEQLADYKQKAATIAYQHMLSKAQNAWTSDLSSWQIRDPIVGQAVAAAKNGGDASIQQVARNLVSGAETPEDRLRLSLLLKQEIFANAQGKDSFFSNTNPDAAYSMAQKVITENRVSKAMSNVKAPGTPAKTSVGNQGFLEGDIYGWLFGERK